TALEAHLESCHNCRGMRDVYRTVTDILRAPVEPFALSQLQQRALERWSEQQEASRRRRPLSALLYPALAAGLLVLLLALISGRWSPDRSGRPRRQLATAWRPNRNADAPRPSSKSVSAAPAEKGRSTSDGSSERIRKEASPERTRGGMEDSSSGRLVRGV